MGPFEDVEYKVENGVAWVRLNRPEKYNAFTSRMRQELKSIWAGLREDDEVGAVVLTGAGDRAFCTGIDRTEGMSEEAMAKNKERSSYVHWDDPGEELCPKSAKLWKPIICAVNGMAAGGAFYMIGECDIVICSEDATFFDPHVTYGMVATYETIHMAQRMPFGELLRMQLLGAHERMSAQRALEIGLVSEICPKEELDDRARWLAETIAARPRDAVQGTVYTAWAAKEYPRSQALELCRTFLAMASSDDNLREGQEFFASGQRVEWKKR